MGLSKLKLSLMTAYDNSLNSTIRGTKLAIFFIVYESVITTVLLGMTEDSQLHQYINKELAWMTKGVMMWIHFDVGLFGMTGGNIFLVTVAGYWVVTLLLHVVCCMTNLLAPLIRLNAEIFQYMLTVPFLAGLALNAYINLQGYSVSAFISLFMMLLTFLYYIFIELVLFDFSLVSTDAFSRSPRERYYLHPMLILLLVLAFLINWFIHLAYLFNIVIFGLLLLNFNSLCNLPWLFRRSCI